MKLYKKIYYKACASLPTSMLKKLCPPTTMLPYHHLVSDGDVPHIKHLYSFKNSRQFASDIDHLLKHFKPVSVETLVESVNRERKLPADSFLLTFDDGLREVSDVIAPILKSKGVPAIFFINPAFIDNRELFYRCKISLVIDAIKKQNNRKLNQEIAKVLDDPERFEVDQISGLLRRINHSNKQVLDVLEKMVGISFAEYLREQKPFLTSEQVDKLRSDGFTIGGHSIDHPYYDLLPIEEKMKQTIESCRFVKEKFSSGINVFSFPHSDARIPQYFFEELEADAFNIDLLFGIQNQKLELTNRMVHRFNAERPDIPMQQQLNGVLMLMIIQQMLGKNKVTRN